MLMDYMQLKAANRVLNLDEARQGLSTLRSRPLYFWFDIYGPCNLKCVHCGFRKDGRTSDQEVSDRVYDEVIRELMPTAYTCNLGGTNWGEMTISKNFHRFLGDCRKYGVKVNLTTNGTRMNDQWLADLVAVAEVVGFSMEGMGEEFEKIRGFPWRRFTDNIRKLVQAKRDAGKSDLRVEWRYCATADSIRQLPEMIKVGKELGINRIQIMPLVPYLPEQKYKNLAYHRSLANEVFATARAVARDLDMAINIPTDYSSGVFDPRLLKIQTKAEVEARAGSPAETVHMVNCYKPWQTCSINELGSVKACGIYWRPAGSLADHSFERVWNGRSYRTMRESINCRPDSICYDCRLSSYEVDSGRVAAELRPSAKQTILQLSRSLMHKQSIKFEGLIDGVEDPLAPAIARSDTH
jgi:MoaA/NifB/PqqE/SkfB family radical SAM enzyme